MAGICQIFLSVRMKMIATDVSQHDYLGDATQAIQQQVRQQAVRAGSKLSIDHQACASDELGKEARDVDEQAEEAGNSGPEAGQHAFPRRGEPQRP
jgi:hypothetical protein